MVVVIPARGNSNGVPRKNLRTLNGHPLLWYAIQNAKKVGDSVIISSEDDEILRYAQNEGCIAIKRDENLSKDTTTIDEVLMSLLEHMDDEVCILQATCPTLKSETIIEMYQTFKTGFDSIASVVDDTHIRIGEPQVNRQYAEKKYKYTGGCVICSKECLEKYGTRLGGNHTIHEISQEESQDIDTEVDFLLAEAILKRLNITIVYSESKEIGLGHFRRAKLLESLFTGHKVNLVHESKIRTSDQKADIIIWDILDINNEPLNPFMAFAVTLENLGNWQGDLCINGIYSSITKNAGYYSGHFWMTLNDDLILNDSYKPDGKVIVAFGGTDASNQAKYYSNTEYDVYTGGRNIDWQDTKYVICGAGNVAIEATARKLPIVVIPQNEREKLHEVNYFYNVNPNPADPCWNELHERAKMYDFSKNNQRIKNLILAKYQDWKLRR